MARPKKNVDTLEPEQKQEIKVEAAQEEEKKEDKRKEIIILPPQSKETDLNKQMNNEKLQKLIKEETKLVKGRFRIYDRPGAKEKVLCRKYPGIPEFDQTMVDGVMYEIPLYVARHLNGIDACAEGCDRNIHTCQQAIHGFKIMNGNLAPSDIAPNGIPVPVVGITWKKKYGFESLEFDSAE